MENDPKWWLDSTTVRGGLMTLIPTLSYILKMFGVEIGDSEQQTIVDGITSLIGLVGVIFVLVGRFKAKSNIKLIK